MSEFARQEIFVATPEDPNHEYIFPNSFNEVNSSPDGFWLIGLTKVRTEMTPKGELLITAFIGDKFVAKDFVFDFLKEVKKVVFSQAYVDGKPISWFSFTESIEKVTSSQ